MRKPTLLEFARIFFGDKISPAQEVLLAADWGAANGRTVHLYGYRDRKGISITKIQEYEPRTRDGEEDGISRRLLCKARTSTSAIEFKATSSRKRKHLRKLRGLIERGQIIFDEAYEQESSSSRNCRGSTDQ